MISCTEFIFAYNELFKFLEKRSGAEGVVKYWEYISDTYVADRLGKCVEKNGVRGCYDYWSKTLSEEAADFTLIYENDVFILEMHHCPSKSRLLENSDMVPYYNYCGHCDLLYRRVLERYGLKYTYDMTGTEHARCSIRVERAMLSTP